MKGFFIGFCQVFIIHAVACGDALPTGFPATFQDVPRENRIEVIAEGYKPFENMKVYQPITITEEQETPIEIPQPTNNTNNPPISTTPPANPVVPPTIPVSNPNPTPAPLPPLSPMPPSPPPSNPGAPVRYTPNPSSTVSDTQFCKNHTNNDANIMRTREGCNKLSGNHKSRCIKCINHAGTYENGRCFVEILHWFCQGTGWSGQDSRSCPDNYKYQGCGMIRKYVDAEQPFTCPQEGTLSGCCQHGGSQGAKHPPFNLDGSKFYEMNCKLPLASNLDWRVAYSTGSAIRVSGVDQPIRNWCMPSSKSAPWNDYNQKGGAKHCATTISGGTTIQQWHTLN